MTEAGLWTPEKAGAVEESFWTFLRFVRINSKEKGGDFPIIDGIYEAQNRYLRCVFDGLADDIHDFKILKSRQLGVCLDPTTRVLTADLRWVPIGELPIGENLISVDEHPPGGRGSGRRMRTGLVEAVVEVHRKAYRITFDDGRSVVCTGQHPWLSKKPIGLKWRSIERPAKNAHDHRCRLEIGDHIRSITTPWDCGSFEDGWFGGMLDGEGSISNGKRSGVSLNVSQRAGPVWDRLVAYASSRGYNFAIENDRTERKTKYGRSPVPKLCFNRLDEVFRLIGQTRPTRFLGKPFWENRELPGKHVGGGWAKIVSMEPLGEQTMIDLQTSAGTYIAEGLVSHNTTITRALVMFWLGMHRGMQGAMVFDTTAHLEEARQEIRDMMRMLPASLKFPAIEDDNRYGLKLANNSRLRFMAAGVRNSRSSGVLGRSSGINLVAASEMCSWENDEGVTSLKSSLSRDYPDRLYIWESTARGMNIWNDMWEEARADDLNQRTCFIGWWAKDNQRIRRGTAKWERYGIDPPNEKEQKRIDLVRELYEFDVDQEQLAWYRELTDPNKERDEGDPEDSYLLQDQPWTEDEAFQLTGSTFFDFGRLGEASRRASSAKFQAFKFFAGSERPNASPGSGFLECEIVPARTWREVEIKIWEEPQTDAVYVVAADPAFGHSEDSCNSAIEIIRCYADCVEQVAEYTCPSVSTHQFAWVCASLVGYYGAQPNSRVMFILELNGPGEAVWREYNSLRQLLTSGYMRAKAREKGLADMFRNMQNYIYQRSDAMGPGHNYHWITSTQRKVAILERLRDYVHSYMLFIRSRDLLEEMRGITRAGDAIGAEGKKRDDRVMAMAMALRAYEEKMRVGLIAGNRTKEADEIARRRSPVDMMRLYNKNMFDQMFRTKQTARNMMALEAAKASWRNR